MTGKDDDRTPERIRLDTWSEANPRDALALVAIAAWLKTTPDQLPPGIRLHSCAASKEAWARVGEAVRDFVEQENEARKEKRLGP